MDAGRLGLVTLAVLCIALALLEHFDLYSLTAAGTKSISRHLSSKQTHLASVGKAYTEKRRINMPVKRDNAQGDIRTLTIKPTYHTSIENSRTRKMLFEKAKIRGSHEYDRRTWSIKTEAFYQVNDEEIYIYSAFLDTRFSPYSIRIFGVQAHNVTSVVGCRPVNNGTSLEVVRETSYAIFRDWPSPKLRYIAYYYGCELRGKPVVADDVSLDLSVHGSNLRTPLPLTKIGGSPDENRGTIAVCVKAIWGNLDPRRLVEWIETNRELGVEKFVFYDRALFGPAARVLRYYSNRGLVEVIPFVFSLKMASLMADDPMRFKLRREDMLLEQAYLVSMNDCYYRLRDRFKYVLLIDVDEVLVPVNNETLPAMIARARQEEAKATSFLFPVAWHFGELGESTFSNSIPSFMYMQRHLKRTRVMKPPSDQPKVVYHTDMSVSISWHGTISIPPNLGYEINIRVKWSKYGFIHHFRNNCEAKYENDECQLMKRMAKVDKVMPRLAHVSGRVQPVLEGLHLL